MSALSLIGGYSSSSEESEIELDEHRPKRQKLQLPDLSSIPVVPTNIHLDEPSLHGGRVRSFPHVRGNWATFVYVKYPEEDTLDNLFERLLPALHCYKNNCYKCDDFHISLSKTVVLQYHQITSFKDSLQEIFAHIKCFHLEFSSINIYCNEDNSRTFISLDVDYSTTQRLLKLVHKVDEVLKDFRLPLFYESPSFHMSICWLNGNKKAELTTLLGKFNSILKKEIGNNLKPILVSDLNCKIGNKYFQFTLQKDIDYEENS